MYQFFSQIFKTFKGKLQTRVLEDEYTDPETFRTNVNYLKFLGLLDFGTLYSKFRVGVTLFLLIGGAFHYHLKGIIDRDELSVLGVMEGYHWLFLLGTSGVSSWTLYRGSQYFVKLENKILNGFYSYSRPLTYKQIRIRSDFNRMIMKLSNIHTTVTLVTTIGQFIRQPTTWGTEPQDKFSLFFEGWVPFEINNWPKYLLVMAFQIAAGLTTCMSMCTFTAIFTSLSGHLIAQIRILHISLKNCFEPTMTYFKGYYFENLNIYENRVLSNIKQCVDHHLVILEYFKGMQTYMNLLLLTTSISTGLMLCTIGYLISDPRSSITNILTFTMVFTLEIAQVYIYCYFGQFIANEHDKIQDIVYFSPWYTHSPKIRRSLQMIMIRCRTSCFLRGAGLQVFSLRGFGEILATSYSYFNMLLAMRNKN